jgi:hypothetical protein
MGHTGDTEMDPHTCAQLIFDKGAKVIQWTHNNLFNKLFWENWISIHKM